MATEMQKQVVIGAAIGVLVSVAVWIFLGGMREELSTAQARIRELEQENARGRQLKANAKKLKDEVDQQTKQLDELIRIMPTDMDRGDLPMKFKKLADTGGIEQRSFKINAPKTTDYYFEHPYSFTYRAGYHGVGQFASLISGFGKLVNIKDMHFKREAGNAYFPMTAELTLSAYVYNPAPPKPVEKPSKPAAGGGAKED